ncbi:hypothetical protein KKF61_04035 [Patescibacteria group bacterium]|nr:hypothetical protein [Patescibacteria group bacterium]
MMKKQEYFIIIVIALILLSGIWWLAVQRPCTSQDGKIINGFSCQCPAKTEWKFGRGCQNDIQLLDNANNNSNFNTNTYQDSAVQKPLDIIPCGERATPSYVPMGKYINCEADKYCQLEKIVTCEVCNKVRWECYPTAEYPK